MNQCSLLFLDFFSFHLFSFIIRWRSKSDASETNVCANVPATESPSRFLTRTVIFSLCFVLIIRVHFRFSINSPGHLHGTIKTMPSKVYFCLWQKLTISTHSNWIQFEAAQRWLSAAIVVVVDHPFVRLLNASLGYSRARNFRSRSRSFIVARTDYTHALNGRVRDLSPAHSARLLLLSSRFGLIAF